MATIAPLPISFNPSDFSSDFLLNAVGNYNGLSATDRSQYSDDLSFEPLQVDAASFDSTMANPGFLNFITGRKAFGANIFVDEAAEKRAQRRNVPSASELQKRLSGGTPMFHEGEGIPKYDPASGLTPQQFWSQYPSFLRAPGLTTKEAVYGRTPTSAEKEEIETSENVSQSYRERPPSFTPSYGRDPRPDPTLATASYPDLESGLAAINRSISMNYHGIPEAEAYANYYHSFRKSGLTPAQAKGKAGTQMGIDAFGKNNGPTPYGIYGGQTSTTTSATPAGSAAHGAQAAGMAGMAAAAAASSAPGGAGHGEGYKKGGKVRSFIE